MLSRLLRLLVALGAAWTAMLALLLFGTLAIRWTVPWLGASWVATAQLTLNCFELAGAGFIAGRLGRPEPWFAVLAFAASLAIPDFSVLGMPLNGLWLLRLTRDVLLDSRFFDSWLTTLGTHLLLLGCVIAGGYLSRPPAAPVSIRLPG